MTTIERAQSFYAQGYSCSQSVLGAFAEAYDLNLTQALRVAAAFGGGISRTGHICGAASGAIMVLGLAEASLDPADKAAKERLYLRGQEFLSQFQSRFGALECKHLLGLDISSPLYLQQARDKGLFELICPGLVSGSVQILEELLAS